jgi:hypothetical protein
MGIESPTTVQPLHSFYDVTHPGEFSIIGTDTDSREHILRVPEPGVVLTPTANIRLAETTVVNGEIAVRIPSESISVLNYSLNPSSNLDSTRRKDPVYRFQGYIDEFLEQNQHFAKYLRRVSLPPRSAFVTDPLQTNVLICIFPSH